MPLLNTSKTIMPQFIIIIILFRCLNIAIEMELLSGI